MATLSTHVLNTANGSPAQGLSLHLEASGGDETWLAMGTAVMTDADGRAKPLPDGAELEPGSYRLTFATGDWHATRGEAYFYPRVRVEFKVHDAAGHLHVPLLLSPFSYTTYRGS